MVYLHKVFCFTSVVIMFAYCKGFLYDIYVFNVSAFLKVILCYGIYFCDIIQDMIKDKRIFFK